MLNIAFKEVDARLIVLEKVKAYHKASGLPKVLPQNPPGSLSPIPTVRFLQRKAWDRPPSPGMLNHAIVTRLGALQPYLQYSGSLAQDALV